MFSEIFLVLVGKMHSYLLVGDIGTVLFAIFSLFTLRRGYFAWITLQNNSHPKVIFHVTIILFAFAELVYSVNLIVNRKYSLWGYAFHICGIFFFTLAYATVLHIWGQTIGSHHKYTRRAGALVITLNAITTIIAVGFLVSSKDFDHFYHRFEVINFILVLVFCLTNVLFTLGMLRYGLSLQERVKKTPITCLADQQKREQVIRRINVVLVVCASCFSLRFVSLAAYSYTLLNDKDALGGGLLGWFLLSSWIPFLVPGVTLLVIMRVQPPPAKGHSSSTSSAPAQLIHSPLLTEQPTFGYSHPTTTAADDTPQLSPGQSRFNSFGRMSSPMLPLPLNLMDLEGMEGLLVESRGSVSSAVSLTPQIDQNHKNTYRVPTK